jgi:hypothetical protein
MFGVQPVTHQSFVLMATIRGGYRWSDRRLPGPDSWTRFSSSAHRADGQPLITSHTGLHRGPVRLRLDQVASRWFDTGNDKPVIDVVRYTKFSSYRQQRYSLVSNGLT